MKTPITKNALAGVSITANPIEPGVRGSLSNKFREDVSRQASSYWDSPILPEFIEVSDVQRIFGLRRTYTFDLIRRGKIKSILLRRPGNTSGKRLVFAPSVKAFLMSQMEETKS